MVAVCDPRTLWCSVLAALWVAFPAIAQDAMRVRDFCDTERYWADKLQGLPQRVGAGCLTEGDCDVPGIRDLYLPDVATPVKTIRLHFVVLREDDGTDPAASANDVATQAAQLNTNYATHKFQFSSTYEFWDNSLYRHLGNNSQIDVMKQAFPYSNSNPFTQCHVFVTDLAAGLGGRGTFPWDQDALTELGGIAIDETHFSPGVQTLTHEVGHNIGLWHTHHGVSEQENLSCGGDGDPCDCPCWERADGVDGDTTGDFCGDTPPTPVNINCSDPGGTDPCSNSPWGVTQPQNYMGYAGTGCWSLLTDHQAGRMHCWVEDSLTSWLPQFNIELDITPSEVPLDGVSVATLTATVTDAEGDPVPDVIVTFAMEDFCSGSFRDCVTDVFLPNPHTQVTDVNGQAQTCYRALEPDTCCYSATIPGDSAIACVDFVAPTTCIEILVQQQGVNPSCRHEIRAEVTVCASGDDIGYGQMFFSVEPGKNVLHFLNSDGELGLEVCEPVSNNGVAEVDLFLTDSVPNLPILACFIPDEDALCLESESVVCVEPVFTFNCSCECEFTDMTLTGELGGILPTIDAGEGGDYWAVLESVGGGSCNGRGVIVWDPYTWEVEWCFDDAKGCWSETSGPNGEYSMAYSDLPRNLANPKILVSSEQDWAVLDPVTGAVTAFEAPDHATGRWYTADTDLSPDGTRLWAIDEVPSPSHVGWLDVATLVMHPVEDRPADLGAVAASHDGTRIAWSAEHDGPPPPENGGFLHIINAQTLAPIASPSLGIAEPHGVAWSPDSQFVVVEVDDTLKVYTRDGAGPVAQIGVPDRVGSLAWSPDGNYIAAHLDLNAGARVLILSWPSGLEVACPCGIESYFDDADSIAWRGDSKVLAVTNTTSMAVHVFAPFDQTDPQLFLSAPPDGLVIETDSVADVDVSGVLMELAADDAGFPRAGLGPAVTWSLNAQPGGSVEVDAVGAFSFTVEDLLPGDHEICVQGRDLAGNLSIEHCRTVTVCGPPQLVVSPIDEDEIIDFGTHPVGEGLLCQVIDVQNAGCQTLTLTCPVLAPPFTMQQCPPAMLEETESGQLVVCLDTAVCGSSKQPVSMVTNDPDTPIFSFIVTGTVIHPADFDADGSVGVTDLLELLANWGPCPAGPCPWDISGPGGNVDGGVGINDFLALLANWGPCS